MDKLDVIGTIQAGEDGWTSSLPVFRFHLERFLKMANDHLNDRFYVDQTVDVVPYVDDDYHSDGEIPHTPRSDNSDGEESSTPITYVRHPTKGTMRVDSYATAIVFKKSDTIVLDS